MVSIKQFTKNMKQAEEITCPLCAECDECQGEIVFDEFHQEYLCKACGLTLYCVNAVM